MSVLKNKLFHYSVLWLGLCAASFFFLTNGLPLWQLLGNADLFSKKALVNQMRGAVLFCALSFVVIRYYQPALVRDFLKKVSINWSQYYVLWIAIFGVLYFLVMTKIAFLRHDAFETRAFDLGIFSQALWSTLHGDFLRSSLKEGMCILGDHFSPIQLLALPFYAVYPHPQTLLLLQVLAVTLCLFPLSKIVSCYFKEHYWKVIFCFLYIIYLPTRSALHEDFHPEVFAEPLLLYALFFLIKNRLGLFITFLSLSVLAKENYWGIMFFFGLYLWIQEKRKGLGSILMFVSCSVFLFVVKGVIPWISGESFLYSGFYRGFLEEPMSLALIFIDPDRWEYLMKLFLPFLYLPFLNFGSLILIAPVFLQNFLSGNEVLRSFNYHYTIGMTPFLFFGFISGLHLLFQKVPVLSIHKTKIIFILLLVGILRSGPSEYYYGWQSLSHQGPHLQVITEEIEKIPSSVSVLTHNNIIPQLINRRDIYQFEYNAKPTKVEQMRRLKPDYVIMHKKFWEPNSVSLNETLAGLSGLPYEIIKRDVDFIVLKRVA